MLLKISNDKITNLLENPKRKKHDKKRMESTLHLMCDEHNTNEQESPHVGIRSPSNLSEVLSIAAYILSSRLRDFVLAPTKLLISPNV